MPSVLFKVNVPYPATFLSTISAQAPHRQAKGAKSFRTFCDNDLRNNVYVIEDWSSVAEAEDYWRSPEAKAHIESWLSIELPEITILREAPED